MFETGTQNQSRAVEPQGPSRDRVQAEAGVSSEIVARHVLGVPSMPALAPLTGVPLPAANDLSSSGDTMISGGISGGSFASVAANADFPPSGAMPVLDAKAATAMAARLRALAGENPCRGGRGLSELAGKLAVLIETRQKRKAEIGVTQMAELIEKAASESERAIVSGTVLGRARRISDHPNLWKASILKFVADEGNANEEVFACAVEASFDTKGGEKSPSIPASHPFSAFELESKGLLSEIRQALVLDSRARLEHVLTEIRKSFEQDLMKLSKEVLAPLLGLFIPPAKLKLAEFHGQVAPERLKPLLALLRNLENEVTGQIIRGAPSWLEENLKSNRSLNLVLLIHWAKSAAGGVARGASVRTVDQYTRELSAIEKGGWIRSEPETIKRGVALIRYAVGVWKEKLSKGSKNVIS